MYHPTWDKDGPTDEVKCMGMFSRSLNPEEVYQKKLRREARRGPGMELRTAGCPSPHQWIEWRLEECSFDQDLIPAHNENYACRVNRKVRWISNLLNQAILLTGKILHRSKKPSIGMDAQLRRLSRDVLGVVALRQRRWNPIRHLQAA
ncbi:MAG: hypothetical protein IT581_08855 [Verrucomicrobiales bacterium]|nr:hypothetical protein [Verrucomicrobiales bacterium]